MFLPVARLRKSTDNYSKTGYCRAGLCLYHLSGSADIAGTMSPFPQLHAAISVTRQDTFSELASLQMTVQIHFRQMPRLNTIKHEEAKIFIL